jgi:hypothetical protein
VLAATSAFGKWEKKQYSPSHKTTTFKKHMYKKERKHFFFSLAALSAAVKVAATLCFILPLPKMSPGPMDWPSRKFLGLKTHCLLGSSDWTLTPRGTYTS